MTLNLVIALMIAIIFFVTSFGLYVTFKKNFQSSTEGQSKTKRRGELGFFMLMIGLILTVSAYGFSFILTTTDYCIVDGILDSLNKTKLQNCISKSSDFNMLTYYIGFAGIILLAVASYLFSPLTFKKSRT